MPSATRARDPEAVDQFELQVKGRAWRGWKSVTVTRSLEAIAGTFTATVYDRADPIPIVPGDEIVAAFAGAPLVSGFVDGVRARYSTTEHSIEVRGRDRTADLVDCSAMNDPGEWKNVTLEALARALVDPFAIPIDYLAGELDLFESFKLNPGDSVHATLERACRLRGVLARTNGDGRLRLERPGEERAEVSIEQGANLETGDLEWSHADRFARYIVRGQQRGDDSGWGKSSAAIEGTAEDAEVERFRPLLVVAEGEVGPAIAQQRARWEAAWRAARGTPVRVTLPTWTQREGGAVWSPGLLVQVKIPALRLEDELRVSSVTLSHSKQRTSAALELLRPDAFLPKPEVEKEHEPSQGWGNAAAAADEAGE